MKKQMTLEQLQRAWSLGATHYHNVDEGCVLGKIIDGERNINNVLIDRQNEWYKIRFLAVDVYDNYMRPIDYSPLNGD